MVENPAGRVGGDGHVEVEEVVLSSVAMSAVALSNAPGKAERNSATRVASAVPAPVAR
jgi:hypothetical protein